MIIKKLVKKTRRLIFNAVWFVCKKREMTSSILRKLRKNYHDVDIGLYSYGCFDPTKIASGTKIGRYCSFAQNCYRFNGNHGLEFISLHPYLYNTRLGMVKSETISRTKCIIEDDVWVGHGAIILPSVKFIGRGAIIAAGCVVTKDVPRYAICAGNPSRIVKFRFNDDTIKKIENTEWWLWDKNRLAEELKSNPSMIYNPAKHIKGV